MQWILYRTYINRMSNIVKISVIIPFKGKFIQIIKLLDVLNKQTKLPDEIS